MTAGQTSLSKITKKIGAKYSLPQTVRYVIILRFKRLFNLLKINKLTRGLRSFF